MNARAEAIAAIRAYADWLEAHPDVPAPTSIDMITHHHRSKISPADSLRLALYLVHEYGAVKESISAQNRWVRIKPVGPLVEMTLFLASDRPAQDDW